MVQRMLGPRGLSANALASEIGVHQSTLSRWVRAAEATIAPVSNTKRERDLGAARRPEDWSPAERLQAVIEASSLSDGELGAYLRRSGLHEATLAEWRATALDALGTRKPSAKEAKRVRELERELRRKDRALAEAAALLVLQKKVQAIWGDEDESTDPRSDE
jgi:transposase